MLAVTTFPLGAAYANEFLKTFVKHWPGYLIAYVEEEPDFESPFVEYRELYKIPGLKAFIDAAPKDPRSYMFDVGRFAHKAYVQLETMKEADHFFWLDADLTFYKSAPEWFLEQLLEDVALVYLGRQGAYTETGIIGFNTTHEDFRGFEDRYRAMYDNDRIYGLDAWTDCHAFDAARRGVAARNMSPEGKGVEHVFVTSAFGKFADHRKGARKLLKKSPEHPHL